MKHLKEFFTALIFILAVILDCIAYPIQNLFKKKPFQITQYYLKCIENKSNLKNN